MHGSLKIARWIIAMIYLLDHLAAIGWSRAVTVIMLHDNTMP